MDSTITSTRMNRQPSPSQGRKARTKKGLTRTALCLVRMPLTFLLLPALASNELESGYITTKIFYSQNLNKKGDLQ